MDKETGKRIIEIKGVKMEVDLRSAEVQQVSSLKVGDKVKVLKPKYGDGFQVYPGVVVGFENFQALPTIVIAILDLSYSGAKLEFFHYNSAVEKCEVILAVDDYVKFDATGAVEAMDKAITAKQRETEDLIKQKEYFILHFNEYFKGEEVSKIS